MVAGPVQHNENVLQFRSVVGLDPPGPAVTGPEAAATMFLEETAEHQHLRAELRAYYADLLTDEVRAGLSEGGEGGELWRQVVGTIGKDGWLGIGWPKEFGGQGRSATEQFLFFTETRRAGAPFPFVTINTVGPTLMRYGTDEQRAFFLPRILAGELNFAIGYTETGGRDRPRVARDPRSARRGRVRGERGQDLHQRGRHGGLHLARRRTDPEAPKHKGISMLLVPTSTPGFSWNIIDTVGGLTTTATYYQDVRVPVENRVGEENAGWTMITNQLNHERVGLAAWSGLSLRLLEDVARWAAGPPTDDGRRLIDQPWVQLDLARAAADARGHAAPQLADGGLGGRRHARAGRVLGGQGVRHRADGGDLPSAPRHRGAAGYLPLGSPGAVLRGRLEAFGRQAQINTFGGGVNEVQREIVAMAGLGCGGVEMTATDAESSTARRTSTPSSARVPVRSCSRRTRSTRR